MPCPKIARTSRNECGCHFFGNSQRPTTGALTACEGKFVGSRLLASPRHAVRGPQVRPALTRMDYLLVFPGVTLALPLLSVVRPALGVALST